ncbi:hypothetical protein JTB14_006316 [Gonioctena quinquepunctata]|nr:hypothetical protein JTB14_006316 [Gonioctena quinquepunctata]
MKQLYFVFVALFVLIGCTTIKADSDDIVGEGTVEKVDIDIGASREGSRTDDEVVKREEEAIKLDGLNVAQLREIREKSEKFAFQTEVNRMMKLIINSLYRNKEIFLRELISNASDALDKIRMLSLTDKDVLNAQPEMNIRIKADKETGMLHITDTGIGMTKADLVNNLGTIAKSGTAEFLTKMQNDETTQDMNDMIGQFGVGFYSAFLVADRVTVTSKHNEDKQYIWESDSASFSIIEDPRGDSLKRGSTISLELKPEAKDFLEHETIRNLVKKYSQFINFPIYLWTSHTETVEEPLDDEAEEKPEPSEEEDAAVEEEKEEDKPKTKKVEKTIWDWELLNDSKPLWTRKPSEVEDKEYDEFYKALTKDTKDPLTKIHFVAEGEVTFKALLFVPTLQPSESFNRYGTKTDNIKLFVRRVFITDEFNDMMPSYLSFIRGIVDSDDLPLNVSRETLQQHKLIKVIKKKLVRKVLDMLKKLPEEDYEKFWKEFSTNIKLGSIEDPANRTRLAKLLRFLSSNGGQLTGLSEYKLENPPLSNVCFAKATLYLVEAVDEYAISAIPEFEGKKFQNVAKEGFSLSEVEGDKEQLEQLKSTFEPLTKWLSDDALKDEVAKATVSERLSDSPCALVASMFGWTGNMERLATSNAHQKSDDPQRTYYLNQKKTLEINPRHPLMKELLKRVNDDPSDPTAKDMARMMFQTATLRSGYMLRETAAFAQSIETMMRKSLGIPLDEQVEEEEDVPEDGIPEEENLDAEAKDDDHDEL